MDHKEMKQKGKTGEEAFNSWLQEYGLSYLYINQEPEKFSTLFKNFLKRPDFLILFESIGMIAVDVKNQEISGGVYTLGYEEEVRRVLMFERLFHIPVWYAYMGDGKYKNKWHWISAIKAVEVGEIRKNEKKETEFLAIKLKEFEEVETNDDLAKLYISRLGSLEKLSKEN